MSKHFVLITMSLWQWLCLWNLFLTEKQMAVFHQWIEYEFSLLPYYFLSWKQIHSLWIINVLADRDKDLGYQKGQ